jgi:hypothetical protein
VDKQEGLVKIDMFAGFLTPEMRIAKSIASPVISRDAPSEVLEETSKNFRDHP